ARYPGVCWSAKRLRLARKRQGVRPGKMCYAPVAAREMGQDSPASWISERGKRSVQRSGRIFSHPVNYLAESLERASIFWLQFAEAAGPRRSHDANASLFTTYGILVGSPPYLPSSTSISPRTQRPAMPFLGSVSSRVIG